MYIGGVAASDDKGLSGFAFAVIDPTLQRNIGDCLTDCQQATSLPSRSNILLPS